MPVFKSNYSLKHLEAITLPARSASLCFLLPSGLLKITWPGVCGCRRQRGPVRPTKTCVCVWERRPARCYDSSYGDLIRLWMVTACPYMSACKDVLCWFRKYINTLFFQTCATGRGGASYHWQNVFYVDRSSSIFNFNNNEDAFSLLFVFSGVTACSLSLLSFHWWFNDEKL